MTLATVLACFERGWDRGSSMAPVSAAHSGNLGDVIYSLPAARALGVSRYVLNCCHDPGIWERKLSADGARFLAPLLLAQPGIQRVEIVRVPVDLYGMRGELVSEGIPLERADPSAVGVEFLFDRFRLDPAVCIKHLTLSHADAVGAAVDATQRFLDLPGLARLRELSADSDAPIVVSLTPRYRTARTEFFARLLKGFPRVVKVGLRTEADAFEGIPGDIFSARDALELAELIASARLFIGAPSLPYAIAEGLKVPRLVDVYEALPNAYPLGEAGWRLSGDWDHARDQLAALYAEDPSTATPRAPDGRLDPDMSAGAALCGIGRLRRVRDGGGSRSTERWGEGGVTTLEVLLPPIGLEATEVAVGIADRPGWYEIRSPRLRDGNGAIRWSLEEDVQPSTIATTVTDDGLPVLLRADDRPYLYFRQTQADSRLPLAIPRETVVHAGQGAVLTMGVRALVPAESALAETLWMGASAATEAAINRLSTENRHLGERIDSLLASTSWRLAAPLRWIATRICRLRGGRGRG